jgi:hypothetical protein
MSRGLGAVERFVLEFLMSRFWSESTSTIVQILAKQRKVEPSAALEASVRRALAALLRKGLIRRDSNKNWRSVESEKREEEVAKEEERKRRESERARWRRKPESERRYREKMEGAQARAKAVERQSSNPRLVKASRHARLRP